jgi:hypothetical protein
MRALYVSIAAAAFVAVGCAGNEIPSRELARTEAAVRAADEVGANGVPRAALHLKMARDQLQLAQHYINEEEEALARAALERATYDAETALALAREDQTRQAAREARKKVEVLRTSAQQ